MANIFDNEIEQSAVQVVKETMKVFLSDDGIPMVSFATNKGKGTGAQVMAVSDFADYVSAVSHYAENGVNEIPSDENLSPSEMVHQTISLDDGVISFRIKSGKGSKPAKLNADEFSEVSGLLAATVDAVEAAGERLS
jgi:hypothetical protein